MTSRLIAVAVAVVLLAGAPAQAASGITVISPKAGATLPDGRRPTFKLRVNRPGVVYVRVCKSKKKNATGLICPTEAIGKAKRGRGGVYTFKPKLFEFPDFWLNSPGTYYWQAHRIRCEGRDLNDCNQEGPITRIRVG